jgi:hypothetical protein
LGGGCHLVVGFGDLPAPSALGACAKPDPEEVADPEFSVGLTFVNKDELPVQGVLGVRACRTEETPSLNCGSPLTALTTVDESGRADLTIKGVGKGQSFYLRAEKDDAYFPASIFTLPDIKHPAQLPPLLAFDQDLVNSIAAQAMLERTPDVDERGHMAVIVRDCLGDPVPGIDVQIANAFDDKTSPFARDPQAPSGYARRQVTQDDGMVIYLSLLAAADTFSVGVILVDTSNQRNLTESPIQVPVRKGEVTIFLVEPKLAQRQ